MNLNKGQEEALEIAVMRHKLGYKFTTIAGPAGSGKSTLVKFIVKALPYKENDICYCAFTGKACQVLLKKGNKNVSTLHRLLYESVPKPDGTFLRKKKIFGINIKSKEIPYSLRKLPRHKLSILAD